MAEESDAGDEPVDGESVDSEGDPAVADSEEAEATPDEDGGAPEGGSSGDGTDASDGVDGPGGREAGDGVADSEAAEQETDPGPPAEDDVSAETRSRPVGAVTDPTAPPAASSPDVAEEGEEAAGEEAVGDGEQADEPAAGAADGVDEATDDGDGATEAGDDADDGAEDDAGGDGGEGPTTFDADEAREAGEWAHDVAASSSEYEPVDPGADGAGDAVKPRPGSGDPMESGALGEAAEVEEFPEGPPDDQEMPLADHIEEMVVRLAIVAAVATLVAGSVFFFEPLAEDIIMFIWNSVIPSPNVANVPPQVGGTAWPGHFVSTNVAPSNPRVYGPLELKLTEIKFASLVGFIVALPVFVYETYRFMRPGLYPNERRYYLAAVPTSLVLAFIGVSFAYFIILPAIFAYFVRYSERAGLLAFALRQTFDLILVLMGYMALVFQIPLFIMLAIMMGLTDRAWMEDRRLYFWGGFLGVAFLFVPEPTGMAPILVALTMIGLFEGTLALLRWTGN